MSIIQKIKRFLAGLIITRHYLPAKLLLKQVQMENLSLQKIKTGKYAVVAASSRYVGVDTEEYYWLMCVNVGKEPQRIILSNDNLFKTNCDECVK